MRAVVYVAVTDTVNSTLNPKQLDYLSPAALTWQSECVQQGPQDGASPEFQLIVQPTTGCHPRGERTDRSVVYNVKPQDDTPVTVFTPAVTATLLLAAQ